MNLLKYVDSVLIGVVLVSALGSAMAEEIRVAVASNFTDAIRDLAARFEQHSGHKVALSFGSTGKHYAQIKNGAPFEAFFAADVKRAKRLEQEGVAVPESRFTYAVGRLVLWSPRAGYVDKQAKVLDTGAFRHLAIANAKLAPYGDAARQVLDARGLWEAVQARLVQGENIAQTYQFVHTGNAELGFVAYSQLNKPDQPVEGSYWEVPQELYRPIEQQAVLLQDVPAARDFLEFVKGDEARAIIHGYGYATP